MVLKDSWAVVAVGGDPDREDSIRSELRRLLEAIGARQPIKLDYELLGGNEIALAVTAAVCESRVFSDPLVEECVGIGLNDVSRLSLADGATGARCRTYTIMGKVTFEGPDPAVAKRADAMGAIPGFWGDHIQHCPPTPLSAAPALYAPRDSPLLLALLMGTHGRLGADSLIGGLPDGILQGIASDALGVTLVVAFATDAGVLEPS